VPIHESFQGKTIWKGEVEIFDVEGHPEAKRCYGWGFKEEKGKTEFVTVLELPPVTSPETAVRAYLINLAKKQ
ncbi:MAG TPA: hypothetical protein VJ873_09760, partial [bacterium]|nr:hypothetical protein [bacterium]